MNIKQFSNSVARNLKKELLKINESFWVTCESSNSSVKSNSNYIDISCYDDDLDFNISTIKISDHFQKGTCDYNFDVTGFKLDKILVMEVVCNIIKKMNIR